MLLPFAYVFNKFEIFSGMTICSEQYILDKTIFDTIFFLYPFLLPFWLGISQYSVCAFLMIYSWNIRMEKKNLVKFAQKLYTQKPLFGWRKSFFFFFRAMKKFYTKTLKKVFHIFYGCYDFIRYEIKIPIYKFNGDV